MLGALKRALHRWDIDGRIRRSGWTGIYVGDYRSAPAWAYTIGFTHDLGVFHHIETGVGANVTAYAIPAAIRPYYGDHPAGVNMYLRFRLKSGS